MTTRFFEKITSELENPFWVHPRDWYDWMLNVDQVKFEVDFNDGFGGSASGNNTVDLVTGNPDDTIYDRDFRWLPTQRDQRYLDAYDHLRPSFYSFTPGPREALPFPPTNYSSDIESEPGTYGEYGVSSWRDWPLFEDEDFSYTDSVISMRNIEQTINPKVMWRKIWKDEDRDEGLPNPGFRYQIPMSCLAGVDMGSCSYPGFYSLNFNPNIGPTPYMAIYDSVFEGAAAFIGGNAYADEIEDPLEHDGGPSDGWEEMNVEFKLVALSGREYVVRPRIQSGLESATAFIEPDPRFNEELFPFAKNGDVNYGGYECSGYATATLQKT